AVPHGPPAPWPTLALLSRVYVSGALPQQPFDRTAADVANGPAGDAGDNSDDRDRAEIHATLFRWAGCLVCLDGGGGGLGVREMPSQRARRSPPLGVRVRSAHCRPAQMALRADHGERDDERH